jgi:hypothetical protein
MTMKEKEPVTHLCLLGTGIILFWQESHGHDKKRSETKKPTSQKIPKRV